MKKPTLDTYKELELRKRFKRYAVDKYLETGDTIWKHWVTELGAEIRQTKRDIRSYNRITNLQYKVTCIANTFDSVIEKHDLGPVSDWKDGPYLQDYMDKIWMEPVNSMYDCTGCLFSTKIVVKELHGHTIVYHWISRDV